MKLSKSLKKGGEVMRKVMLVTLVLSLLMGIASLAWTSELQLQNEVKVWRWDEETEDWKLEPTGSKTAKARVWHQGVVQSGYCNKKTWEIDVATHASVAQWIRWNLSAQGWRLFIRKPGKYLANCIIGQIKSNADVLVTFSGFDDLKNDRGEAIETWYAFGQEIPENLTWYPAKTLDQQTLEVPYCQHSAHLWIMVNVREDPDDLYPKTRACEYQDDAQINLTVTVYKPWLDTAGLGIFAEGN
ncbi:hypothetical protein H5T89_07075 [bacterium]|nr:hypothetical protein [bacterium]